MTGNVSCVAISNCRYYGLRDAVGFLLFQSLIDNDDVQLYDKPGEIMDSVLRYWTDIEQMVNYAGLE